MSYFPIKLSHRSVLKPPVRLLIPRLGECSRAAFPQPHPAGTPGWRTSSLSFLWQSLPEGAVWVRMASLLPSWHESGLAQAMCWQEARKSPPSSLHSDSVSQAGTTQGNTCGHSHCHSAKMLQKLMSNPASVSQQGRAGGCSLSSELISPPIGIAQRLIYPT